ncbi:hypothetical protein [Saccharospirillum mangrovi]|uniref:hypothetical protein n=1 Tax=Saccharospirillum mangrovi TaxID=2161747 RepID=UPI000D3D04FA|nr:hypothetical protein [Saccharospirillum mangrovi]
MSQTYFDLYYRGDVLDGYSADQVRRDLAVLFKTDDARVATYFSGRTEVIKLRVAEVTVARYQRALRDIGAELIVVPEGAPAPADPRPIQPTAAPVSIDTSSLSLAQTGADVLDERPQQPAAVAVSGLSLSDTGADLRDTTGAAQDDVPKPPDTSHLTLK